MSHSFTIASGDPLLEPRAFGVTAGTVAVWVFFALSGFLIYKSFERQTLWSFAQSRILRIYPALAVVALISVLVLGPLVTTESFGAYVRERQTIEYIPRALSLKFVSFALPGVFSGNPYPAVNGPLWTLYYEVVCYFGLVVGLTLFRSFRLFLLVYAVLLFLGRDTLYAPLSMAFVTGMAIYRYRSRIPSYAPLAALLIGAGIIAPTIAPVSVGYASLWCAELKGPQLAYNRVGDYSYGLYIYGWPVQELVVWFLPGISPGLLTTIALPAALACAAVSWYVIERPALALKGKQLTGLLWPRLRISKLPLSPRSP